MCGYYGIINRNKPLDLEQCKEGLKILNHRGPDSSSYFFDGKTIFLGHNRLRIIDLSDDAKQPMLIENEQIGLVFNGEIYNYKELRADLSDRSFVSTSDTEVILRGYQEHGISFFRRLRGMYSFAIVDKRQNNNKLILVRDPAGIKPLYYALHNESILFGSELKAITPFLQRVEPDEITIKQYLNLGFCPEPYTAYKGIFAINPGHILELDLRTWNHKESSFFSYNFDTTNHYSFQENKERVKELLATAVQRNLVADVEISVALSGGIDSSLLYYYSNYTNQNINGITIKFGKDKDFDESQMSAIYAKQLNGRHHIVEIDEGFSIEIFNSLLDHFDQPFSDTSLIPVYYLTKYSREAGKVLLGGDGGDELFLGYPSQFLLHSIYNLRKIFPIIKTFSYAAEKFLGGEKKRQFGRVKGIINDDIFHALYNRSSWFEINAKFNSCKAFKFSLEECLPRYMELFQSEIPSTDNGAIVFEYFRKIMLSDYLRKVDMMSMKNGMEVRVPFLDEDLTRFALSIPFKQKTTKGNHKRILREIHTEFYPAFTSKAQKAGFGIPLDRYLSKKDKEFIVNTLLSTYKLILATYINFDYLKFLCQEFIHYKSVKLLSRTGVYQRIIILYSFCRWSLKNFN